MKYRVGDVILCQFTITDVDRTTGYIFVRGAEGGPNIVVADDDIVKLESRALQAGDFVTWQHGKAEASGEIVATHEEHAWVRSTEGLAAGMHSLRMKKLSPILNPGAPRAPKHVIDDDDDDEEEFYHNNKRGGSLVISGVSSSMLYLRLKRGERWRPEKWSGGWCSMNAQGEFNEYKFPVDDKPYRCTPLKMAVEEAIKRYGHRWYRVDADGNPISRDYPND